jgi:ABC-type transport system involved in cytochrome c biogenesis ATPase subunit
MSNRKITDHQFSAGTTIDATQIDQSLEDALQTMLHIGHQLGLKSVLTLNLMLMVR